MDPFMEWRLPGGITMTSRVRAEDLMELRAGIRAWDLRESTMFGDEPTLLCQDARWAACRAADGSLLGVWTSVPVEGLPPSARGWGWLTTDAVDRHPLAYCRAARATIAAWWEIEPEEVREAFICVLGGHRQAEGYLRRFTDAECVEAEFDIQGHIHSVWRLARPRKEA